MLTWLYLAAAAVPMTSAAVEAAGVREVVVTARSPLSAQSTGAQGGAVSVTRIEGPLAGGSAVLRSLEQNAAGVSLGDGPGSPFQRSLVYRGFQASPLQGASQGLAVYVDGVRFNQPFGDTVDWDLIPDAAVRSLTLEGANPLFGLNALGGSLSVSLKTGFSDPGGEVEGAVGDFGRRSASVAAGGASGDLGFFLAAGGQDERGWRDVSKQRVRQLYADVGARRGGWESHAGVVLARNRLYGEGPAPVELLDADRRAVFTHPDTTGNRFALLRASSEGPLREGLRLTASAYLSRLRQTTANGDASDAEACEDDAGALCLEEDGPPLTDASGAPIPDFLGGGPYAQFNATRTRTDGAGVAVHLSADGRLLGRPNAAVLGVALDRGRTRFEATSALGALTEDRGFGGPGVLIDQEGGPITPVSLVARNTYAAVYGADTVGLTDKLSLSLSARLTEARISLTDRLGDALNGKHRYRRLDPAAALTWRPRAGLAAYLGYAEASRAPTPAELSCADPDSPCSLTNFFLSDPELKAPRAHTWEAGLRGRTGAAAGLQVHWSAGLFRADTEQDITFVMSQVRGRGFFQNVGSTRRQGLEAAISAERGPWRAWANYSLTDAKFRSPLVLSSPDHPQAGEMGRIFVSRGDSLPGAPRHRLNVGLAWAPGPWRLELRARTASSQAFFGDEANLAPRLKGYAVADLGAGLRLWGRTEVFVDVRNLTDRRYATFGTFTETSAVALAEAPGASDPRSVTPAEPRSVLAGLRISF